MYNYSLKAGPSLLTKYNKAEGLREARQQAAYCEPAVPTWLKYGGALVLFNLIRGALPLAPFQAEAPKSADTPAGPKGPAAATFRQPSIAVVAPISDATANATQTQAQSAPPAVG